MDDGAWTTIVELQLRPDGVAPDDIVGRPVDVENRSRRYASERIR
jgi:hypothetical protein